MDLFLMYEIYMKYIYIYIYIYGLTRVKYIFSLLYYIFTGPFHFIQNNVPFAARMHGNSIFVLFLNPSFLSYCM